MNWHYSVNNERKGPVEPVAILALEGAKVIGADSLVWAEGMDGWKKLSEVRDQVTAESGGSSVADFGVCAFSSEVHPRADLVEYGDKLISANHKDAFLQSLQEGQDVNQLGAGVLQYVGFWWRVLASFIDYLVKMAVSMVVGIASAAVMIPMLSSGNSDQAVVQGIFQGVSGLIQILFSVLYETIMVGKWGGTAGKLALGFRIVDADGGKVSYLKAFGRWWGETITKTVMYIPPLVAGGVVVWRMISSGVLSENTGPDAVFSMLTSMGVAMGISSLLMILFGFGYWMCGRDPEKRTLHDRLCNTRVVRK